MILTMQMQNIFEFNKTLLDRFNEIKNVLNYNENPIPASKVREEWAKYAEIYLEPAGWQAFWKVPRVICEELKIKYPTIVQGNVEQVLFDGLKAEFSIEKVTEDIDIPQKHEVFLEDLWAKKNQFEESLNIERTANTIDCLRFFYQHIWMPWDYEDDDDEDWSAKHLEKRMKFYCDIVNKNMSRSLLSHIRILWSEAQYIQQRREYLEMDLGDEDEEEEIDDDIENNMHVTKLMRLHLRLKIIKNEFEMLENPDIREVYEIIKFPGGNQSDMTSSDKNLREIGEDFTDFYIVVGKGKLKDQLDYLNKTREIIGDDKVVQIKSSLQEAVDNSKSSAEIYISPGQHSMKFLNYLNSNGAIKAITKANFFESASKSTESKLQNFNGEANIISYDEDSILLAVDGDFTFENLVLKCDNVRMGVLIKKGNVTFRNCYIYDTQLSFSKKGIVIFGGSSITFENCVIRNFATAIYCNCSTKIILKNTMISDCSVGIELREKSDLNITEAHIKGCLQYGIVMDYMQTSASTLGNNNEVINDINLFESKEITVMGNCCFENNKKGNLIINMKGDSSLNNSCYDEMNTEDASGNSTDDQPSRKRKNDDQLI